MKAFEQTEAARSLWPSSLLLPEASHKNLTREKLFNPQRKGTSLSPKTAGLWDESGQTGLAKGLQFSVLTLYSLTYHIPPRLLLMKITNKQSIIRLEKTFIWANVRTSPEADFPGHSEKLLQRNRVFSSFISCQTKEQQTSHSYISLRFQKKKKEQSSMYTVSHLALSPGKSLIVKGVASISVQEEKHLIFVFNLNILTFGCMYFSRIIKANVQRTFDSPQRGCSSQSKIQVNPSIS